MAGAGDRHVETASGARLVLGSLRGAEHEQLYSIFSDVVATRDGYPQEPPLTREVFEATWVGPEVSVFGARPPEGGRLLGAYYLKANFAPRAGHIANAGYVVEAGCRGRGVGRALVEDSIVRAPSLGFRAIQFNLVFASNPARKLYEELGLR
ncbi:MAG: GNAT family N-acetyltransferase, partial [Acidimicrobiales bacterium]